MKLFHKLSKLSDQELVVRMLAGREEAFAEMVRRYMGPVARVIYAKVGNRPRTEDLAMETFAKAFAALHTYRPERPFGPWICTIAANTAIDYLRIRPFDVASNPTTALLDVMAEDLPDFALLTIDPNDDENPPSALEEPIETVLEAARQLRPKYRQCLLLFYIAGRSYREIAATMEMPIGSVGTCLTRARQELKKILRTEIQRSPSDRLSA